MSIQVFYNKTGVIKYGRARHYRGQLNEKPQFEYHQQSLAYIQRKLNEMQKKDNPITIGQSGHIGQEINVDLEKAHSSTFLEKDWASSSVRIEHQPPKHLNVDQYRDFLSSKFCKSYATTLLNNSVKHYDCYENPSKLLALSNSNRLNILKAMVNLSKFLGTYEEYKSRLKNYGIKWTSEDTAFNGFLSVFSKQHDTLPQYLRDIQSILTPNEQLFVKFLAVSGLRKNEALTSFNMIIRLNSEEKLCEYYNEELSVLEHFKYKVFLRRTKNAYISFVSRTLINEICNSQPVTYNAIHCRFARRRMKLRLKELRSYHNSYLRKNGVISELVDILAGRVPKSVFCRHYLGQDMKAFGNVVLGIEDNLEKTLTTLAI